jgi:hypothetical protein
MIRDLPVSAIEVRRNIKRIESAVAALMLNPQTYVEQSTALLQVCADLDALIDRALLNQAGNFNSVENL